MTTFQPQRALIVGAGPGLSAALAKCFAGAGMQVALAARGPDKISAVASQTGSAVFHCDAADSDSVAKLFEEVERGIGIPDVVVYNPSARVRGPLVDLNPDEVRRAVSITALGGMYVAHQAARRMLPRGQRAILFTGASASVKGYPQSAAFAMGKFALRGLAQSIARELAPQGIHVAHFVIDGRINPSPRDQTVTDESMLDPDAIAATYLNVLRQPRSAWTWEVELRPWTEKF